MVGYSYKELFTHAVKLSLGSISFEYNKFFITKYTNNDGNVLSQKGDKISVIGFCRSLIYENENFYVVLTNELKDVLPQTTLAKQKLDESNETSILEVADKLKKLKELLDLGAINKEEYDKEKAKLLNR